jgi:hypothetical protein
MRKSLLIAVAGCTCAVLGVARDAGAQAYFYPDGPYTVDTPNAGNYADIGKDQNGNTSDPDTSLP